MRYLYQMLKTFLTLPVRYQLTITGTEPVWVKTPPQQSGTGTGTAKFRLTIHVVSLPVRLHHVAYHMFPIPGTKSAHVAAPALKT